MPPIKTILHPTDFSKSSQNALEVAGSLAAAQGARLIVLHILQGVEPPEWIDQRMPGEFPWTEDCHTILEQSLRSVRQSSPGLRIESRVLEGIPSEEILRVAESESCDLIVMGTHGRAGLARDLMGSVTEEVMRKSRCPVLTVKAPRPAASIAPGANDPEPAEMAGTE